MATKKKVTKKVVSESASHTKKPYTKKEMEEIHALVDKVLLGKVDATPEELQGLVIVTHKNEDGRFLTLGGRRNMSDGNSMQLFLRVLGMSALDGAVMLATINSQEEEQSGAKKPVVKKRK